MKNYKTKRDRESDDLSRKLIDYYPHIIADLTQLGYSQRDIAYGLDLVRKWNVPQRTTEEAISKARKDPRIKKYMEISPMKKREHRQRYSK